MPEIKLTRRYPESRLEDVTDAYMRGVEVGRAMRMRATDQSEIEQSIVDLWAVVSELREWVDDHKNGITQEDFYAREFVYWSINKEPLERLDVLERRVERIEKLLSHKTGKHDSNQEEPGGADELADESDLKAENAKLRELVCISIEHCNSGTCDECTIQGEDGSCPYADIARELGIEVDA